MQQIITDTVVTKNLLSNHEVQDTVVSSDVT